MDQRNVEIVRRTHHVTSISISLHQSPNSNKQISIRHNWTQFETVDNLMEWMLFYVRQHQICSMHTRVHARVWPNQIIAIACIPYARSEEIYTNIVAYTLSVLLLWATDGNLISDSIAKNTISIHLSLPVLYCECFSRWDQSLNPNHLRYQLKRMKIQLCQHFTL